MVDIYLKFLGPFEALKQDGTYIDLPTRKAHALLAMLALEPNGVSRDQVAHLLWGERSQERARHNVRQTLSKIRKTAGAIVVSNGEMLRLDAALCTSDIAGFEMLADSADASSLGQCLDLCRGTFLEGISANEIEFETWIEESRLGWQRRVSGVLDRLIRLLIAAEDYAPAVDRLAARLRMDPACEPAHRNLMSIYAATERRSDALRQFRLCEEALRRDLAADPSAETVALFDEISNAGIDPQRHKVHESVQAIAATSDKPKVAVLPFNNLSNDADGYFADGVTEDIITALSRFHSLQVIARGSSFVYKNKNIPDGEIAAAMGAQYLVRGSIQKSNERVRISVQLLDGPAELTIWAHRFDQELHDIFQIQDEITATVVSTLADRVEASQLGRVRRLPDARLAAYDFLLRGKDHHHRYNAEDCAVCIDMFDHAIAKDPGYAHAHAWLACGLGQAIAFGLDEPNTLMDRSQKAAEQGLVLDENDSECHRVLAQIHMTRGDLERAQQHQERALFLNPNDDRSVCAMGEILSYRGRCDEGERWVRKSMSLNPYHPQRYNTHLARSLLHQAKYAEALKLLSQIGRPRRDGLAYSVVAHVRLGDVSGLAKSLAALRLAHADFLVEQFLATQPYERPEDRLLILEALREADLA